MDLKTPDSLRLQNETVEAIEVLGRFIFRAIGIVHAFPSSIVRVFPLLVVFLWLIGAQTLLSYGVIWHSLSIGSRIALKPEGSSELIQVEIDQSLLNFFSGKKFCIE